MYAFGGLTATQTSAATVSRISTAGVSSLAPLPTPLHDASAAALGGRPYVLGGGQSVSYSGIGRYDPGSGGTRLVGALPTPLSDLSTATIGSTTYVVGGFTGAVFSNRILAYAGGRSARVVGRLPLGLRYAAVAAVGGRLVIAGGRTQAGATAAVLSFDPATGRTTQIGRLPQPLMHASAGVIGETAYVVGGQTAAGTPTQLGARDRSRGPCAPRAPSRPPALGRRRGDDAGRPGGGRRMGRAGAGGQRVAPAYEHVHAAAAARTGLGAPARPRCSAGRFRETC